jgi:hypothetical protein
MAHMVTTTARRRLTVPRSSLAVPALAVLGGGAFFVWKPGVAVSTFASPRAAGFVAAVGVLTLFIGWVLPRLGRGFAVTAAAQAIPVALVFIVTVLPSFRTVTVNDPLPGPVAAPIAGSVSPVPVPAPLAVSRGNLSGIHHRASGTAVLLQLADGSRVVRLEDLDVEPGPDYFVVAVPGADRQRPDGGTRLHHLRGNKGNQNYPVPADLMLMRPFTVLIWCRAFAVPVAAATLR